MTHGRRSYCGGSTVTSVSDCSPRRGPPRAEAGAGTPVRVPRGHTLGRGFGGAPRAVGCPAAAPTAPAPTDTPDCDGRSRRENRQSPSGRVHGATPLPGCSAGCAAGSRGDPPQGDRTGGRLAPLLKMRGNTAHILRFVGSGVLAYGGVRFRYGLKRMRVCGIFRCASVLLSSPHDMPL